MGRISFPTSLPPPFFWFSRRPHLPGNFNETFLAQATFLSVFWKLFFTSDMTRCGVYSLRCLYFALNDLRL